MVWAGRNVHTTIMLIRVDKHGHQCLCKRANISHITFIRDETQESFETRTFLGWVKTGRTHYDGFTWNAYRIKRNIIHGWQDGRWTISSLPVSDIKLRALLVHAKWPLWDVFYFSFSFLFLLPMNSVRKTWCTTSRNPGMSNLSAVYRNNASSNSTWANNLIVENPSKSNQIILISIVVLRLSNSCIGWHDHVGQRSVKNVSWPECGSLCFVYFI